jgi:hypothetical protein
MSVRECYQSNVAQTSGAAAAGQNRTISSSLWIMTVVFESRLFYSESRDLSKQTANNTASGNMIMNVSQEYHGTASLIVGYTQSTLIEHNEIAHVSYSGVRTSHLLFRQPLRLAQPATQASQLVTQRGLKCALKRGLGPQVSLSWGWGAASYGGNNHIVNNHIHHVMCGELLDGGCACSGQAYN